MEILIHNETGEQRIKNNVTQTQFEKLCLSVIENNFNVKYDKIWLLDNGNPICIFNTLTEKYTKFISPNYSFNGISKNIDIAYKKFIISAWGSLLYLVINDLPSANTNNDVEIFMKKFQPDYMEKLALLLYNDENSGEDSEWVSSGMEIDGIKYLTRSVVDYLLNSCVTLLNEPLTIFRDEYYMSSDEKYDGYIGWVSTSLSEYNEKNSDKYILPIGFPVIDTFIDNKFWADDNEFIIRNENLKLF